MVQAQHSPDTIASYRQQCINSKTTPQPPPKSQHFSAVHEIRWFYGNVNHQPICKMPAMLREKNGEEEWNWSETTASHVRRYLLPFRTIVPIKGIMRPKFMAIWKCLLPKNGTYCSRHRFAIPLRSNISNTEDVRRGIVLCVASILRLRAFFLCKSFLPCLIWCLWPLKRKIAGMSWISKYTNRHGRQWV